MVMAVARHLQNGRVLADLIRLEALRVQALNEEGVDAEQYDATHSVAIQCLRIESYGLPSIEADGKELEDFTKETLANAGVVFTDSRCLGYLLDVVKDYADEFGWWTK